MIMRIWKHIRKYWFYIVCSLIFAALSVASQLYVPILTGNAIDHMIGVGKVDFAGVAAIVRVIVAATAVTAISQWIFGICNNKITYNVSRDLRNAAIAKIQRLPVSYLDADRRSGQPCDRRCRAVCRRTFDGIYPVFYRSSDDPRNTGFYAVCQCADHARRCVRHTAQLYSGRFYRKENVS